MTDFEQTSDVERSASSRSTDLYQALAKLLNTIVEDQLRIRERSCRGSNAIEKEFQRETATAVSPKGVRDIVEELIQAKRDDGLSVRYIQTLRSHLGRFAAAFKQGITVITAPEIERWLRELNMGARARNNIRGSVLTLFHFARKQGYLPKGKATEADEVARAKAVGGKVGILKPEELGRIIGPAPDQIQLFLALGAFTGMRSSEIVRLEWSDVNFDRSFITVAPEKAKTATRRLVPVLPNLMAWLQSYRGAQGTIFRARRDVDRAILFAKSYGINWPNNALRHSYATYRLAVTMNAPQVALEMGTSPVKLMRNYRELADLKEGQAWFSILPTAQ